MKKKVILVSILLLFSGCQKGAEKIEDTLYKEYEKYVAKIENQKEFSSNSENFNIKVVKNILQDGRFRYDIIIDEPKISMYNIKAIVKMKENKEYIYPSIGILEKEKFSLLPGAIDKKNNIYKGINLSGISVHSNIIVYVYITYKQNDDKKIENYIEVPVDATR